MSLGLELNKIMPFVNLSSELKSVNPIMSFYLLEYSLNLAERLIP
jgi:hypothetical protein